MAFVLTFVGPIARPRDEAIASAQQRHFDAVEDLLAHLGYLPVQFPHIAVLHEGRRLHAREPVPDQGEVIVMVPTGGG